MSMGTASGRSRRPDGEAAARDAAEGAAPSDAAGRSPDCTPVPRARFRVKFPAFPYASPYPVQLALMQALCRSLDAGALGLFESPTGTGKTLTLMCGTLHWIEDCRERERQGSGEDGEQRSDGNVAGDRTQQDGERLAHGEERGRQENTTGQGVASNVPPTARAGEGLLPGVTPSSAASSLPAWMLEAARREPERCARERREAEEAAKREAEARRALGRGLFVARAAPAALGSTASSVRATRGSFEHVSPLSPEDAAFLIEPSAEEEAGVESGRACNGGKGPPLGEAPYALSPERRGVRRPRVLLEDPRDVGGDGTLSSALPGSTHLSSSSLAPRSPTLPRLIFASRTHSQLSQFVREFRRTPFADRLSLVSLAGRNALCINSAARRGGASGALLNERCLDLRGPPESGNGGDGRGGGGGGGSGRVSSSLSSSPSPLRVCPFKHCASSSAAVRFGAIVEAAPMDVEELARLGRRRGTCPYYASRRAAAWADVVLVPYASLLSRDAREGVGLDVSGAVVLFDEAHNVLDAIASAHAAAATLPALQDAARAIQGYLRVYGNRLHPSSCARLQTLLAVASGSVKLLEARNEKRQSEPKGDPLPACVLSISSFLASVEAEHVNLLALARSARETKTIPKIAGWWERERTKEAERQARQAAEAGPTPEACGVTPLPPHEATANAGRTPPPTPPAAPRTASLRSLFALLEAFSRADADGAVLLDARGPTPTVAFCLLSPAGAFADIAKRARAVVLASGTLAPDADLAELANCVASDQGGGTTRPRQDQFAAPGDAADRPRTETKGPHPTSLRTSRSRPPRAPLPVRRFSCGHVIEPWRAKALAIGVVERSAMPPSAGGAAPAPARTPLDLRASAAHTAAGAAARRAAAAAIARVAELCPGGVVAFAPSFEAVGALERELLAIEGVRAADEEDDDAAVEGTGADAASGVVLLREPRAGEPQSAPSRRASSGPSRGLPTDVFGHENASETTSAALERIVGLHARLATRRADWSVSRRARTADVEAPTRSTTASPSGATTRPPTPVLLCVVGGRLSEGINFSDGLARVVCVAGIPAPDARDPELRARLAHAAGLRAVPPPPVEVAMSDPGVRARYEALTARALNQAVGRAVRHAKDAAAVVLLDQRYHRGARAASGAPGDRAAGRSGATARLPRWLGPIEAPETLGEGLATLRSFFDRVCDDAAERRSLESE